VATAHRVFASLLAWTVGAVTAVGVGLLALSLIGDGLSVNTGQPLTPDAIAREASSAPEPRPGPPPAPVVTPTKGTPSKQPSSRESTGPPAPTARPTSRIFTTSGGTAIARCTGNLAYLVSWSPREGYRYDNVERGPDDRVRVRFRSDDHKVDLRVTCVRGVPQARVDDD
jgi:hypothetical protein